MHWRGTARIYTGSENYCKFFLYCARLKELLAVKSTKPVSSFPCQQSFALLLYEIHNCSEAIKKISLTRCAQLLIPLTVSNCCPTVVTDNSQVHGIENVITKSYFRFEHAFSISNPANV